VDDCGNISNFEIPAEESDPFHKVEAIDIYVKFY
jgi:hypothetical protein